MKKLIAGNWKMNKTTIEAKDLIQDIIANYEACQSAEILICPPFTQLYQANELLRETNIRLGAQDCSNQEGGAYTGQISATMLKDLGCSHVILGHSERRSIIKESDALIAEKLKTAQGKGLHVILCVGEEDKDREAGKHKDIVQKQLDMSLPGDAILDSLTIAYEPVWAIGTGKTATSADISEMHGFINKYLSERFGEMGSRLRILYGGSVKPTNANEILNIDHVGGALVGGASLNADDFLAIYRGVFVN